MSATCVIGGGAYLGLTWVGYPAWLALRAAARAKAPDEAAREPFAGTVAIVVVARDAAADIARRIAELGALRVPERVTLEAIVVVDDGSHDGTADLAERCASAVGGATALRVLRQGRLGKAAGLARAVASVAADVVVFADVRQTIPPEALALLLAPFSDRAVGVVSGVVLKPGPSGAALYWRYESWVRRLESRSGSTVGATGPWYALRRELFVAPPAGLLLDDVWIPMQAVFAGARAVVAEAARVHDVRQPGAAERDKKARTLTGNLQLLAAWPALLDPRKNPLWGRFMAHKVARLATPFAVTAVALGGVGLALTPGVLQPLGVALGVAELGLLASALAGSRTSREVRHIFGLLGASFEAWWRHLRRDYRW